MTVALTFGGGAGAWAATPTVIGPTDVIAYITFNHEPWTQEGTAGYGAVSHGFVYGIAEEERTEMEFDLSGVVGGGYTATLRPYNDLAVSPTVGTGRLIRAGAQSRNGQIQGVGEQHFRVQNLKIAKGRAFDAQGVADAAQEAVIDDNTAKVLFEDKDPIGQVILMGDVPARVVGVTAKPEGLAALARGETMQVWAPYTTVMGRMMRQPNVGQISVRLKEGVSSLAAEKALVTTLTAEHGQQDFFVMSSDTMKKQLGQITLIFSALFGSIGGISLLVGGIGVMNIMLVSVSERTREIGVRTAVGARRSDIMSQFMIEAVLVCLIGGAFGVALSMAIGGIFSLFVKSFQLVYSGWTLLAAFGVSTLIGLIFGWLPARNAAALDPVDALARE